MKLRLHWTHVLLLAIVIACFFVAIRPRAEDAAGTVLNQDWIGFGISYDHLRKSLADYVAAKTQAETAADERTKWLLDHPEWLGAPPKAKK
jgi:hypothetical protein